MKRMPVTRARDHLGDLLRRVSGEKKRIILQRRGRDVAAVIPVADLAFPERCEDLTDIRVARESRSKAKRIEWPALKSELGL